MAPDFDGFNFSEAPRSNWNSENGYNHSEGVESYPYRVFGTGRHASFTIMLKILNQDIDYLCSGASQGFKISIQAPNEEPQLWKNYFYVSPLRTALVKITPKITITSNSVRKYSPKIRQCFFNSERRLRFYSFYTQRNCEMECLANFTASQCGCLKFQMPSKNAIVNHSVSMIDTVDQIKHFNY